MEKLVLDFDPETKSELVSVNEKLVKFLKPHQVSECLLQCFLLFSFPVFVFIKLSSIICVSNTHVIKVSTHQVPLRWKEVSNCINGSFFYFYFYNFIVNCCFLIYFPNFVKTNVYGMSMPTPNLDFGWM